MTNDDIIEQLDLTASLLEINGENSFKSDSYKRAVFNLEKLGKDLFAMSSEEISKLDGVGKSIASAINQIKERGSFDELEKLKVSIPSGVIEMLSINGIGPKKIRTIWQELNIDNKSDLLEACKAGLVAKQKGFGEKTQKMIQSNLLFEIDQAGKLRLDQALSVAYEIHKAILSEFDTVEACGQLHTKEEIIDCLEFIVGTQNVLDAQKKLAAIEILHQNPAKSSPFIWRGNIKDTDIKAVIYITDLQYFTNEKYIRSASTEHLAEYVHENKTLLDYLKTTPLTSEKELFERLNLPYIAPELREGMGEWELARNGELPELISYQDLKGPLHNHSTWSDGKHTLLQMSEYCITQNWEYLGISDHSQSAAYANGLYPERVLAQHKDIDLLNAEFTNFKIFKGIESDILTDGSLDYSNDLLQMFDYIVASVHSGLSMDEEKATQRLIRAVENPFTTILGHPTGRLLLKRKGYPVDFIKVIDACAANHVAIEINSNPWRLDMSWRYIKYALDKGVKIAICPDAHENEGFLDMQYGVWMGRKGFLSAENCINCMSKDDLESYFKSKK